MNSTTNILRNLKLNTSFLSVGIRILIVTALLLQLLIFSIGPRNSNHYTYLASSFLSGSLSIKETPPVLIDLAYYRGKYYLPLGPLPSVLLLPFVAIFGNAFQENYLKVPLSILSLILVFRICQKLKVGSNKAFFISTFFILGSVYTPVAAFPYSSYFSQIVATCAILLAIHEYLGKRRWLVVGIFISAATLTRLELLALSTFFLLAILREKKLNQLAKFLMPVILTVLSIGLYNLARFDSVLETGHDHIINLNHMDALKSQGMFSTKHIPANLKYMLLKTPNLILNNNHSLKRPYLTADQFGLSIFILSPILFLTFRSNLKNKDVSESFIATIIVLVPITTFYGIGYTQIGYRFALGFLPLLLIPLCSAAKQTSTLTLSILVSLGLLTTWYFIFARLAGY